MNRRTRLIKPLVVAMPLLTACASVPDDPLVSALQSDAPAIRAVMERSGRHQLQILYSRIERTPAGDIEFSDYSWNLDRGNYFYPASTVKLPAAVLALEYLDTIDAVTPHTPYTIAGDPRQHTVADDIREIFAVSDNEAYNRLYELLGRDYMNRALRSRGIGPVRLSHRLSTPDSEERDRVPLLFQVNGRVIELGGGMDAPIEPVDLQNVEKGVGYICEGELVHEPMDFSRKNYFPLQTQHELMKRLFFPAQFSDAERFRLSTESYALLYRHMHRAPRANGYDEADYPDSYGKFFMFGDSNARIPAHIRIYNKVGWAYGTLTETAYIVNEREGIEFMLSATILVNENRIYNDDEYEFESLGVPFLAALGREIHQLERLLRTD